MDGLFENATRIMARFPSTRGLVGVEDLWYLSVEELDGIFKKLNAERKTESEESLLDRATREDPTLDIQIGVIKRIVEVKLAEAKAKVDEKTRADERQKLLAILATKKAAALENLSEAEIEAKLAELS